MESTWSSPHLVCEKARMASIRPGPGIGFWVSEFMHGVGKSRSPFDFECDNEEGSPEMHPSLEIRTLM